MTSRRSILTLCLAVACGFLAPEAAFAADLNGAAMRWPWALPFIGILLSIATGPLLFPRIWHAHYGKIAAAWALLTLAPLALAFGASAALAAFVHAMIAEYMSFIILLFALYTVAGGVLITGNLGGRPLSNALVLAFGAAIASVVGTTGAAMVLVRPLIRANAVREHNVHVVVFFIILVANIGGALSPLGDPPLFVGFLHGVDFFWPLTHLWKQTLIAGAFVLVVFVVVDVVYARREPRMVPKSEPLRVHGLINLALIATIIGAILLSAAWKPGVTLTIYGTPLELQNLARDIALIVIALLSLKLTPDEHRAANDFTWEPIREVAKLFAGIFVCIIPVLAVLHAGRDGAFAFLLDAVTTRNGEPHEAAYFWLTGGLSAFLDNAPTYLVFFELAGGNAPELMGPLAGTLAAISMGAVYMGALTYIGNAPNLMVYAIASERGVKMPSFFGYFLWAACVLVPLFLILTLLPIAPILKLS
ncbi:MAG TPA: sodium:proton antiporter [Pseudolabrys sp.]|jgi:Na+/H+ antiporter NhaD/arsenite permease-like protein